jgi:hypothetical protein
MGWMAGFNIRAGERAHEENMLDIQQKVEKHKAFSAHMQKISEDPTYLPEAQEAAKRRWLEAQQAGPMKFKNYDISDILTVKNPATSSVPKPPQVDAAGSLAGAARGDYSPQEIGGVDPSQRMFIGPQGEDTSRSGKWSPFELNAMEAQAYADKMSAAYATQEKVAALRNQGAANKVSGRAIPADEVDLAQMDLKQPDGTPYPAGDYYIQYMQSGAPRITPALEHATRLMPPVYRNGKLEYDVFDPRGGGVSPVGGTEGITPVPPKIATTDQKASNGVYYHVNYDEMTGQVISYVPFTPTAAQVGSITSREAYENTGDALIRVQLNQQVMPGYKGPATFGMTPQTGASGIQAGAPTSAIQFPTAPPTMGQPAPVTPAQPAQPAAAGVTPQLPPVVAPKNRTVSAAITASSDTKALPEVSTTTPINSKNVGASLRPDFELNRGNLVNNRLRDLGIKLTSGQKYDPRMPVIEKVAGPLTRYQQDRIEKDGNIRRQVIERIQGVYERAGMLDNMLTAGKLQIAVDPKLSYKLITRVLGRLSPEEAQLAADFTALKEDIQNMRGPMGAAGFRSLEAFMALQDQRGSLLGDVNLTKNVLRNSIRVFLALQAADRRTLAHNNRTSNLADDIIEGQYLLAYPPTRKADGTMDISRAVRAMRMDGWED